MLEYAVYTDNSNPNWGFADYQVDNVCCGSIANTVRLDLILLLQFLLFKHVNFLFS